MLTAKQIDHFKQHGYVVAKGGATPVQLRALIDELDGWIEQSRHHSKNFGSMDDGKARFDLEDGHTKDQPRLRRVANPADISDAYQEVLWHGTIPDMVVDLIGPNVKFHHCKLNIKLPGMLTRVEYHQDHVYDPHTNDDMLTALLMIDEMNEANGCLRVVPGSHKERYTHFQGDEFVGQTAPELRDEFDRRAVRVCGAPGDVCLMHTWTVHGSEANRSAAPRRLLICDYNAADAFPLLAPAVPSPYTGRIVRGEATRFARLRSSTIEMREPYRHDSFFGLQGQQSAGHG